MTAVQSIHSTDAKREWELRVRLAAAYRIVHHLGWTETIYGHLTLKVPGPSITS